MHIQELAVELGFIPVTLDSGAVYVYAQRGADLEALRQLARQMCPFSKFEIMYIGYDFDKHLMGMRIE